MVLKTQSPCLYLQRTGIIDVCYRARVSLGLHHHQIQGRLPCLREAVPVLRKVKIKLGVMFHDYDPVI